MKLPALIELQRRYRALPADKQSDFDQQIARSDIAHKDDVLSLLRSTTKLTDANLAALPTDLSNADFGLITYQFSEKLTYFENLQAAPAPTDVTSESIPELVLDSDEDDGAGIGKKAKNKGHKKESSLVDADDDNFSIGDAQSVAGRSIDVMGSVDGGDDRSLLGHDGPGRGLSSAAAPGATLAAVATATPSWFRRTFLPVGLIELLNPDHSPIPPARFNLDNAVSSYKNSNAIMSLLYAIASGVGGVAAYKYFGTISADCARLLNAQCQVVFGAPLPFEGYYVESATYKGAPFTNILFNAAAFIIIGEILGSLFTNHKDGKAYKTSKILSILAVGSIAFLPYRELMIEETFRDRALPNFTNWVVSLVGAAGVWDALEKTIYAFQQNRKNMRSLQVTGGTEAFMGPNTSKELQEQLHMLAKSLKPQYAGSINVRKWAQSTLANEGLDKAIAGLVRLDPAHNQLTPEQLDSLGLDFFRFIATLPRLELPKVPSDAKENRKGYALAFASVFTVLGLCISGVLDYNIGLGIVICIVLPFEMIKFALVYFEQCIMTPGISAFDHHNVFSKAFWTEQIFNKNFWGNSENYVEMVAVVATAVFALAAVFSWPATTTAMLKVSENTEGLIALLSFIATCVIAASTIVANTLSIIPVIPAFVLQVATGVFRNTPMSVAAIGDNVVTQTVSALEQLGNRVYEVTQTDRNHIHRALTEAGLAPAPRGRTDTVYAPA